MQNKASISDYFFALLTITITLLFFSWRWASISIFILSIAGISGLFFLEALKATHRLHSYQQFMRAIALLISVVLIMTIVKPAG